MTYRLPLVEVIWDDAAADGSWEEAEALPDGPEKVTTVGFLAKETDGYLWIASTDDGYHTNARMKIPKGMVISRKVLKVRREKGG